MVHSYARLRETETDRQTDRDRERQTDRETDMQTDKHSIRNEGSMQTRNMTARDE